MARLAQFWARLSDELVLAVPDKTIQRISRHSNTAVTMNSYVKSLDAQSIAAMQQLEKLVDVKLLANSESKI